MTEEQKIKEKIEKLKKVKRTDDNLSEYAEAQYRLGEMYDLNLNNYEQAEKYYLNVSKNNSPEWYSIAQHRLGEMYDLNLNNYEQAEKYYLNVSKNNSPEWYSIAQYRLGEIYHFDKKNYLQAEAYYLNVLKVDNPEWYAMAQYQLGVIYHFNKENYVQAEAYYLNVLKADNSEWYAMAQYRLGVIYQLKHKNYTQAEIYYVNVLKADNPEWYAIAQGRLGEIYNLKHKNYAQAETYYLNILEDDNPIWHAIAQCHLGNMSFKQNKLELAYAYYKNVRFVHKASYYKAQLYLVLIDNKGNDDCIKEIQSNLKKIDKCVVQIKDKLLVKLNLENNFERKVAHYTKPEVLFHFLKDESKMRLSLVDLMNDPTENKVLFNWLNINSNQDSNKVKSFVSSFSFNHNSLNQFRLYGLEDNVNGSGVSIVFNKSFFCKEPKEAINYEKITNKKNNKVIEEVLEESKNSENVNESIFPLPLYRCVYFDPESNYIKIAKRNKQSFYREFSDEKEIKIERKWKKYIKDINEAEIVKDIRKNLKEIKEKTEESIKKIEEAEKSYLLTVFEELIHLAIMPISCLIKHSAFEDEDECRIMYTTHDSDNLIIRSKEFHTTNMRYLEYSTVKNYIAKLYLGPKCRSHNQQWIKEDIDNRLNIRVEDSKLPLQ